jgi:BirA family biotin operon repressor/biotin-[acetyl-CoA-carboxylase] ligase
MKIIKLNAIDSTNAFLKCLAKDKTTENFTIVVAEHQTNGKGQRGAEWLSQTGKNLTFSVLCNFKLNEISLFTLNIITAISIVKGLKKASNLNFQIKWPNDILAENKKIAGILIENSFNGQNDIQTIIGIGINVNQENFNQLPQASSLFLLDNKEFDKDVLLIEIVNELKSNLEAVKLLGEDCFWNEYHEILYKKGIVSTFEDIQSKRFVGKILGVTREGKLEVVLDNEMIVIYDLKEIKMLY